MGALSFMVAVAQSVEYRIVIPVAAGSIPVSHPLYDRFSECGGIGRRARLRI